MDRLRATLSSSSSILLVPHCGSFSGTGYLGGGYGEHAASEHPVAALRSPVMREPAYVVSGDWFVLAASTADSAGPLALGSSALAPLRSVPP